VANNCRFCCSPDIIALCNVGFCRHDLTDKLTWKERKKKEFIFNERFIRRGEFDYGLFNDAVSSSDKTE
jgi:hypothetical protein